MDGKKLSGLMVDSTEVFHTTRVKIYPDGAREILSCSRPIFREPGYEDAKIEKMPRRKKMDGATSAGSSERAARRAAQRVRDIALSNDFKWFVTLTLDASKIDRYDIAAITKRLSVWCDNHVRRDGLRYVLVPERHQDGALHFHGFFNDIDGFEFSGTWSVPGHKKPCRPRSKRELEAWASSADCHPVYNFEPWSYGFTTAIQLYGDYSRAVAYVCKYIRKQQESGKIGGRWYYSGGKLQEPEKQLCDLTLSELCEIAGESVYRFDVDEARASFGCVRVVAEDFAN